MVPRADTGYREMEGSDGSGVCGVCMGMPEALVSVARHWGWAGIWRQFSLSVTKGSENSVFQTWPSILY